MELKPAEIEVTERKAVEDVDEVGNIDVEDLSAEKEPFRAKWFL